MSMRRYRSTAAWLALLAIALQAFWPLLAQAKPKNALLVPVCTVQGVTHYVELPSGDAPVERKAASQHDHCSFCASGGALASAVQVFKVVEVSSLPLPAPEEASIESQPVFSARPRGPPFLPKVDLTNNFGRNHEEASVVGPRGARGGDAIAGRGIVRRGVLLA